MDIDRTKEIKYLLIRCKSLKESMLRTLSDTTLHPSGRYASFKAYVEEYDYLAKRVIEIVGVKNERILSFDVKNMKDWGDTLWPQQKSIIDRVLLYDDTLIALLEKEVGFVEDEFTTLESFIHNKLRTVVFEAPDKEISVQNALETLFVGRGWNKGIDYDRETGKIEFSGREYIPDFIVPSYGLCIEVKLLKDNRKSRVIEEINSDLTAYSKQYERILFVVYDMGFIRDEVEFKRDIENSKKGVRVVIVKH